MVQMFPSNIDLPLVAAELKGSKSTLKKNNNAKRHLNGKKNKVTENNVVKFFLANDKDAE